MMTNNNRSQWVRRVCPITTSTNPKTSKVQDSQYSNLRMLTQTKSKKSKRRSKTWRSLKCSSIKESSNCSKAMERSRENLKRWGSRIGSKLTIGASRWSKGASSTPTWTCTNWQSSIRMEATIWWRWRSTRSMIWKGWLRKDRLASVESTLPFLKR